MIKFLIRLVLLYIVATAITTVAMYDFSPRHTLFLLADALLVLLGAKLVREDRSYYKGIALTLGILCSVFVIRYLTLTALKVWDVDIYISFSLAVANVVIMLTAILPKCFLKKLRCLLRERCSLCRL